MDDDPDSEKTSSSNVTSSDEHLKQSEISHLDLADHN